MKPAESKKKLLTRIKRAQGQVAAIHRMLDEDAACTDVLLQISAVQGALNKAGQDLLSNHIQNCLNEAFDDANAEAKTEKMAKLLNIFEKYTHIGGRS
jgi:DNA-binding FrmR family transcriptional regulator